MDRAKCARGDEPEIPLPPKPLGRRVVTAFASLVLLNVLVGIVFIIGKKGDTGELRAREAATRQQLTDSLQRPRKPRFLCLRLARTFIFRPLCPTRTPRRQRHPAGNASGRFRGESAAGRAADYRHRRFAIRSRRRISPFARAARSARLFAAACRAIGGSRRNARSCRCESARRCPPLLRDAELNDRDHVCAAGGKFRFRRSPRKPGPQFSRRCGKHSWHAAREIRRCDSHRSRPENFLASEWRVCCGASNLNI